MRMRQGPPCAFGADGKCSGKLGLVGDLRRDEIAWNAEVTSVEAEDELCRGHLDRFFTRPKNDCFCSTCSKVLTKGQGTFRAAARFTEHASPFDAYCETHYKMAQKHFGALAAATAAAEAEMTALVGDSAASPVEQAAPVVEVPPIPMVEAPPTEDRESIVRRIQRDLAAVQKLDAIPGPFGGTVDLAGYTVAILPKPRKAMVGDTQLKKRLRKMEHIVGAICKP
jgi:hypothetical protein